MKLDQVKRAVIKAEQALKAAETKAAEFRQKAKAAKALADQARSEFKALRKAAKQAKKLAAEAEDEAQEQAAAFSKAKKRLAKAVKKAGKPKHRKSHPAAVSQTEPAAPTVAVLPPPAPPLETPTASTAL